MELFFLSESDSFCCLCKFFLITAIIDTNQTNPLFPIKRRARQTRCENLQKGQEISQSQNVECVWKTYGAEENRV